MIWTVEIDSPVPAARMFEAVIVDWHNLGPKIIPGILKSGTTEGLVRQLDFTDEIPYKYVKEFINYLNDHELECIFTTMEGGYMETKLKFEFTRYKFVPASDGSGCVVKVEVTNEALTGTEESVLEEDIDKVKDALVKQLKAAETYLLDNPDEYKVIRSRGGPRDRGIWKDLARVAGKVIPVLYKEVKEIYKNK